METDIGTTIGSIFRNASLLQTSQFSGCETLELAEMGPDFKLGQVVSRRINLIVISAPEIMMILKIHFNPSEADQLRRIKFPDQCTDPAVAAAKTADYMKELTNQMCGRICRIFQQGDLALGMSIPLSMHGFYELYTDYTPSDGVLKKFGQGWRIQGDFGSLVCTAQVEIMDPNAVNNLQLADEQPPEDDDGEVEFL